MPETMSLSFHILTLLSLFESGVMIGDVSKYKLRDSTHRRINQLRMNRASAQTLKLIELKDRVDAGVPDLP